MASTVEDVRDLMSKKDSIEAEIKELMDVLESQKGVGMNGPLVDKEQFPRADIDVYTVRHSRNRVICLQNDLKALMVEIEDGLHAVHALAREQKEKEQLKSGPGGSGNTDIIRPAKSPRRSFAKVDRVGDASPAAKAGLTVGDEFVEFGSVSTDNFKNLQNIGSVVQHSQGIALPVLVLRNGEEIHLSLTPQTWAGRGLLGCNIIPIQS